MLSEPSEDNIGKVKSVLIIISDLVDDRDQKPQVWYRSSIELIEIQT